MALLHFCILLSMALFFFLSVRFEKMTFDRWEANTTAVCVSRDISFA